VPTDDGNWACDVCGRKDCILIGTYTQDGRACSPECCDKLPVNEERAAKWETLKKLLTVDLDRV
jgi:hypothetical protein